LTVTHTTRRQFFKWSAGIAAGAVAVVAADATFVEPNFPQIKNLTIPIRHLAEEFNGFTIVQLSDFHYDPYCSVHPIRAAVHLANSLTPDLVVLTGDFVTMPVWGRERHRWRQALQAADPCAQLLQALKARHGVLASLGNHDEASDPDYVEQSLKRVDIPVLRNQSVPIQRNGKRLWIAGVNDVIGGEADLGLALKGIAASEPKVLLCHEPDFADRAAHFPVDLQLSGHSHGGQVLLPFVGALYLPPLGRKYPWGLRQIGEMKLYTNAGIGTIRLPMRWNCPPEVTRITLQAAP
jgi:predicted MPP superfamily phosphohydrolase